MRHKAIIAELINKGELIENDSDKDSMSDMESDLDGEFRQHDFKE